MTKSELHKHTVKQLLDTKAIDFAGIGKFVAEAGPSLSLADEPGDYFCGTNRIFLHVYRVFNPGLPVESLGELSTNAPELRTQAN